MNMLARRAWRSLTNFLLPHNDLMAQETQRPGRSSIVAIIPTYKPSELTLSLVKQLIDDNNKVEVLVVNDNAPNEENYQNILAEIDTLSQKPGSRVYLINTPYNLYKPGALNYGLKFIKENDLNPTTIITLDDDVSLNSQTITLLVKKLNRNEKIGAVCSWVRIINKNKNLLTRLQGLEYHSFNITKIADNSFFQGPLVMQGMLVAFKYDALTQAKGFSKGHLIEDYHLTARLKKLGWHVAIEPKAQAWTDAPENLKDLWVQRIRWTYGGLNVLGEFLHFTPAIIQDLIGHSLFILTVIAVALSLTMPQFGSDQEILITALVITSILQFCVGYTFNLLVLRSYPDADFWDYLIRGSIVVEFIYANFLTLVLLGSYVFMVYYNVIGGLVKRFRFAANTYERGLEFFKQLGFSGTWVRYSNQTLEGGENTNV
jgi:cellulose synthase/poly-beta-1,6-N-acetylglucosamine synthase-like glycosyltransferase